MANTELKKQRFFIERDLFFQTLTLLLSVLLGGFLLLLLSKTISGFVDSSVLFLLLFVGYFVLIIFFSWSLSRKFIGPFGRLQKSMQDISQGDLSLRLKVRDGDDIRIQNFVSEANRLLAKVNSSLEKISDPTRELEVVTERLITRIASSEDMGTEEHLESLKRLKACAGEIRQSLDQFKTNKWKRAE
ncbi:MAG: methyl-accepting chemotaxis protein [bacterium]|nr:methyl-accepting chemotaxis protein [bacterium]